MSGTRAKQLRRAKVLVAGRIPLTYRKMKKLYTRATEAEQAQIRAIIPPKHFGNV